MKKKTVLLATLAALFAQIIFGFSFMFTRIALDFASPMSVIACRYIVALFGLTIVVFATKTQIRIRKGILWLVLMAVFQPILYFIFESYGMLYSTSAFSSVMISLVPVVAMICGIFTLSEVPALLQYLFAALTVGGVCLMAFVGKSDGTVTVLGIILLLGAVFSAVFYNIISRKISSQYSAIERTYSMAVIGAVGFIILALFETKGDFVQVFAPFTNIQCLVSILYLGIVSSVIAFIMLNYANTYLPIAKTTVFANITTVVSVIAGAVFLDEPFSALSFVAVAMIIIGVWGVQTVNVRKK